MDIYLKKQIKMKNKSINFANFVQVAHDVMIKEARQVENMASLLDENFQKAVEHPLTSLYVDWHASCGFPPSFWPHPSHEDP
jgi:hypothetical protein